MFQWQTSLLAEKIGRSLNFVSQVEGTETIRGVSLETLFKIADVLASLPSRLLKEIKTRVAIYEKVSFQISQQLCTTYLAHRAFLICPIGDLKKRLVQTGYNSLLEQYESMYLWDYMVEC